MPMNNLSATLLLIACAYAVVTIAIVSDDDAADTIVPEQGSPPGLTHTNRAGVEEKADDSRLISMAAQEAIELDGVSPSSRFTERSFPWLHNPGIPLRLLQVPPRGTDVTHSSTLGHGGVEFGSADSWHNKPPRGQDPTLNADQLMEQSDKTDGAHSTFMVCNQHHDLSGLNPMQIVGIEPVITRIPGLNFDNSVVHHMNLFLCTEEEAQRSKIGRCEDGAAVLRGSMSRPCYRMVYAYDRDANPFYFPKDVGVRLGPGSPYTRMVQEWHYLIPKSGIKQRFTDRTHFKLLLTSRLRPHNAAMLAMMNMSMILPSGHRRYHHSFECPARKMNLMLKNDLAKVGGVQPFAVHLHAHRNGRKLWWEHKRGGRVIGEYGRFNKYGGYGPQQSFMHLNNLLNPESLRSEFSPGDEAKLEENDSLVVNCEFDTTDFKSPIRYGLNHGEEMCGFLMMYYPHDWTRIKHHEDACLWSNA